MGHFSSSRMHGLSEGRVIVCALFMITLPVGSAVPSVAVSEDGTGAGSADAYSAPLGTACAGAAAIATNACASGTGVVSFFPDVEMEVCGIVAGATAGGAARVVELGGGSDAGYPSVVGKAFSQGTGTDQQEGAVRSCGGPEDQGAVVGCMVVASISQPEGCVSASGTGEASNFVEETPPVSASAEACYGADAGEIVAPYLEEVEDLLDQDLPPLPPVEGVNCPYRVESIVEGTRDDVGGFFDEEPPQEPPNGPPWLEEDGILESLPGIPGNDQALCDILGLERSSGDEPMVVPVSELTPKGKELLIEATQEAIEDAFTNATNGWGQSEDLSAVKETMLQNLLHDARQLDGEVVAERVR